MSEINYLYPHPEQRPGEVYMGNESFDRLVMMDKWRTRRFGQAAMISPNLTTSGEWEPLQYDTLKPWFIQTSEVEAQIRTGSEEEARCFLPLLDPRWNGITVQGEQS